MAETLEALIGRATACVHCDRYLPHGPRPVFQIGSGARILIAGQAPGSKVHATGIPFDDPSGDRLREWMGVDQETFYDPEKVAILPMGFCYPGKGKSGDLAPRPECAPLWRQPFIDQLRHLKLTLVIGQYAMRWHFPKVMKSGVTEVVKDWRSMPAGVLPLPHPSPRNNIWLKRNSWFAKELLPELRGWVQEALR